MVLVTIFIMFFDLASPVGGACLTNTVVDCFCLTGSAPKSQVLLPNRELSSNMGHYALTFAQKPGLGEWVDYHFSEDDHLTKRPSGKALHGLAEITTRNELRKSRPTSKGCQSPDLLRNLVLATNTAEIPFCAGDRWQLCNPRRGRTMAGLRCFGKGAL